MLNLGYFSLPPSWKQCSGVQGEVMDAGELGLTHSGPIPAVLPLRKVRRSTGTSSKPRLNQHPAKTPWQCLLLSPLPPFLCFSCPCWRPCLWVRRFLIPVQVCRSPALPRWTHACTAAAPPQPLPTCSASRARPGMRLSKTLHTPCTELQQGVGSSYGCWMLPTTLNTIINSFISSLQ